jgi:hypothetical protein
MGPGDYSFVTALDTQVYLFISNKVWFYSTCLLCLLTRQILLSTTTHHFSHGLELRKLHCKWHQRVLITIQAVDKFH